MVTRHAPYVSVPSDVDTLENSTTGKRKGLIGILATVSFSLREEKLDLDMHASTSEPDIGRC